MPLATGRRHRPTSSRKPISLASPSCRDILKVFPFGLPLVVPRLVKSARPTILSPPGTGEPESNIEPKALALLKAMSDTLSAANSLSFVASGAFDLPAANGQPLFCTTPINIYDEVRPL
jgi:hypothetical protein